MTAEGFRRLALSMTHATEGSHMGNADFRVGGHIFATLSLEKQGYGVLMLTPEQQAETVADAPEIFSPVTASQEFCWKSCRPTFSRVRFEPRGRIAYRRT
jgi:hypothetical protein